MFLKLTESNLSEGQGGTGMKVLNGMTEIAGQGIYTVQGLNNNGIYARMAVWRKNPGNYETDIDLNIGYSKLKYPIYSIKMVKFAVGALKKFDIFHFHFGHSLFPYHLDLPFCSYFNKKIYAEFHGSDIRFLFNKEDYKYFKNHRTKTTIRNKKQIEYLIKHSKGIILHDDELKKHLPDTNVPVYKVPLRVDISKFKPQYSNESKCPVIVHAPSRRSGKGTEGILNGLKKIKSDFQLILVEGKSQKEAFDIYKKADIIIDQISVGTYGVFAIEGMALGKPVITYIDDDMRKTFPSTLPIVSAEFQNLPQIVEELIGDLDKRRYLGLEGRKYVERYHDNNKVTKYLAEIYSNEVKDKNIFNLL